MQRLWIFAVVVTCLFCLGLENPAAAELTVEHRRELLSLSRGEMTKVAGHIRKKEFDEAAKLINDVQQRVDEIAKEANLELGDRAFTAVMTAINRQKEVLNRARGTGKSEEKAVSFVGDVAPLINGRCLRCHGAGNASAGLRLDTFANWKAGGRSGLLLTPGAPAQSLLMAKLSAPTDQGGMPRQGEPFNRQELETIALWINQGAKFDGGRENDSLTDLIFEHEKKSLDVKIPKPKGTETVKFTQDIAPWFANLCLRCHNSNRRSGGLSVETFFDIMKGGDSGEVIHPGDMETSRLFRLVGGKELPRMPADNQVRITRRNYEDLVTWFKEGNTYDGSDPRTPIRTFVRSDADMAADRFARMTNEEMQKLRRDRSTDQFKRALPNDPQQSLETNNFLLIGNVAEPRLNDVKGWAEQQLADLQKIFGDSGQPWRGRLAVFVMKDRFSYEEFNEVIERRRASAEMTGHSKVTANFEDAYVVLQDLGDGGGTSLQTSVVEHLTGAYLQRTGVSLPDWLVRGAGIYMASRSPESRKYLQDLRADAVSVAPTVTRPQDIFENGTFSPAVQGAVGYTLVDYLLSTGGNSKFAQLVQSLQRGQSTADALRAAYGADAATVARGYLGSLRK